jgi:hypothetical protein
MDFPDDPAPEIAAERERLVNLISIYTRNPNQLGIAARVMTAATDGLTLAECVTRWGQDFVL